MARGVAKWLVENVDIYIQTCDSDNVVNAINSTEAYLAMTEHAKKSLEGQILQYSLHFIKIAMVCRFL